MTHLTYLWHRQTNTCFLMPENEFYTGKVGIIYGPHLTWVSLPVGESMAHRSHRVSGWGAWSHLISLSHPARRDLDPEQSPGQQVLSLPSSFQGFFSPVPRWWHASAQVWKAGMGFKFLSFWVFNLKVSKSNHSQFLNAAAVFGGCVVCRSLCACILSLTEA